MNHIRLFIRSVIFGNKVSGTSPAQNGHTASIPNGDSPNAVISYRPTKPDEAVQHGKYLFPPEWDLHEATILGFPSQISLPEAHVEKVRKEIVDLAAAISEFEPVRLYTRPEEIPIANKLLSNVILGSHPVTVIPCPVNHPWVRDTGPIYVRDTAGSKQRYAINFDFDEWGEKRPRPGKIWGSEWPVVGHKGLDENRDFAKRVIDSDFSPSPVVRLNPIFKTEGGGLITDGEGTLLVAESYLLCDIRNHGMSKQTIEAELKRLLGAEKVIWFKGLRGKDITDCHVDAVVRFVRPGVVVFSRPHTEQGQEWIDVVDQAREVLSKETDAKGRRFEMHMIHEPNPYDDNEPLIEADEDEAVVSYVNYYHVNGGLIFPRFGNKEKDTIAFELIKKLYYDRECRQLLVNAVPLTGGGIHCVTQQVPA